VDDSSLDVGFFICIADWLKWTMLFFFIARDCKLCSTNRWRNL